jgi:hypothetical protein
MPRVAYATCLNLPEPDADEALLLEASAKAGLDSEFCAWDDPAVDWQQYRIVIPRSTWNYHHHEEAFRTWVQDVSAKTRMMNPANLMLGNIHKEYLLDLEEQGIPIVPTRIITESDLQRVIDETGWQRFVLKPVVSASSYLTGSFERRDINGATQFLLPILERGEAMVQEFMGPVSSGGEVALVHIAGKFSHGVVKSPRFNDGHESVSRAPAVGEEQLDLAKRVLQTVPESWLYARVDVMLDNSGKWVLSELELIEPSLFLVQHPPSADRFVNAVKELVCL